MPIIGMLPGAMRPLRIRLKNGANKADTEVEILATCTELDAIRELVVLLGQDPVGVLRAYKQVQQIKSQLYP